MFNWQVPVGRGKPFFASLPAAVDRIVGGWQTTGILTLSRGRWLTPSYCGYDPVGSPGGAFNCGRPDRIKDGNLPSGQGAKDMWFDLSAFTLPGASPDSPLKPPAAPIGRLGNAGRGILEGPGFWQFDFGLVKGFPMFKERLRASLVMLATNIFNHPNLSDPALDLTTPATVGKIFGIYGDSNTAGIGMRQVQLSLRLEF